MIHARDRAEPVVSGERIDVSGTMWAIRRRSAAPRVDDVGPTTPLFVGDEPETAIRRSRSPCRSGPG